MKIGELSDKLGLSNKTIRYYEEIGLITSVQRASNGYRSYSQANYQQLLFIQHCRGAGFTIEECRQLSELANNTQRHSADVKHLVLSKINDIDQQITQLNKVKHSLNALASRCAGDHHARCAIIDALFESGNIHE